MTLLKRGAPRKILVCLLAFAVLAVCPRLASLGGVRTKNTDVHSALWAADLHGYGYPDPRDKFQSVAWWFRQKGVVFVDAETLAAYFVTQGGPAGLSVRSKPQPTDAYQLHAVFLYSSTGTLKAQKRWPTRANAISSGVLAASSGNFIVRTGELISLEALPSHALAERTLTLRGKEQLESWDVQVVPGGNLVFLNHREGHERNLELLDSHTLEQVAAWREAPGNEQIAASEKAITECLNPGGETTLLFREFMGKWRALYSGCAGPRPFFLSNDFILAQTWNGFVVLSTSGSILFSDQFRTNWSQSALIKTVRPSRDGSRVALSVHSDKDSFADRLLDREPRLAEVRVLVYDLRSRKRIYDLYVDPLPRYNFDCDLSPDGSALAVLSDGVVQAYRLPVSAQP